LEIRTESNLIKKSIARMTKIFILIFIKPIKRMKRSFLEMAFNLCLVEMMMKKKRMKELRNNKILQR
jgi:hypothetical protein